MIRFFILIFLLTTFEHAHSFEIKRDKGKLYLIDKSCDAVMVTATSLYKWKTSVEPKNKCSLSMDKTERSPKGICQLEITSCVPDHVQKYEGLRSDVGPNCFNLALVFKGILPALRYSDPEEISFYMKPPICKPINKNSVKTGDIGLMKAKDAEQPDHAFIYVSDKVVYNKPNSGKDAPYQLMSYSQMQTQQKSALSDVYDDVNLKTSYYRCQSMQSYLSNTPDVPLKILEFFNEVQLFEKCFEGQSTHSIPLSDSAKKSIVDTTKALSVYLLQESAKGIPVDKNTQFLLASLQLRLQSIAVGLSSMSFENRDYESQDLYNKLMPLIKSLRRALVDLKILKPLPKSITRER